MIKRPIPNAGLLIALYYVLDLLFLLAYGFAGFEALPYLLNTAAILAGTLLAGWHTQKASRAVAAY